MEEKASKTYVDAVKVGLETKIDKLIKNLEDKQSENRIIATNLKPSRHDHKENNPEPIIADDKFWEKEDKERRKLNIIITNVAESNAESAEERRDVDEAEICEMLNYIGVEDIQITHSCRLGRPSSTYPRLLRISVTDFRLKVLILRRAKRLKESDRWKGVYMMPDLTLKEREERKKLLGQLKIRKEAGEENLSIFKGKSIKKVPVQKPFHVPSIE